ncbi:MAG: YkvA family protein [Bacteroidota bacterium]
MPAYKELRAQLRKSLQEKGNRTQPFFEYLLLAPDLLHLLSQLVTDRRVNWTEKAKVAAALAYFVSAFDFMPEALMGPAGLAEDVAISLYVINGLINRTNVEVVKDHWAGEEDVLKMAKSSVGIAQEMAGGSVLWKRLRQIIK